MSRLRHAWLEGIQSTESTYVLFWVLHPPGKSGHQLADAVLGIVDVEERGFNLGVWRSHGGGVGGTVVTSVLCKGVEREASCGKVVRCRAGCLIVKKKEGPKNEIK